MSKQIFVSNLPYHLTQEELKQYFEPFGEITHVLILTDRLTQRSRGFGFVTFATETAAQQAIQEMDEKKMDGRLVKVTLARTKEKEFTSDHPPSAEKPTIIQQRKAKTLV